MSEETREIVDPVARAAIAAHEAHCGERWGQARDQLKSLNARLWWLLTAVIGGQSAVILFLIDKLG